MSGDDRRRYYNNYIILAYIMISIAVIHVMSIIEI